MTVHVSTSRFTLSTVQSLGKCMKQYDDTSLWGGLSCAPLTTIKPRFTNDSDHEQFGLRTNFPNTKRLGWLLCLELRTRKPSVWWSDKLGVPASAVFVEEWSSGKYPESATPIGESVSCCVALVHSNSLCLLLNFSVFCVFYKLLNRAPWGQRKTMIAAKW